MWQKIKDALNSSVLWLIFLVGCVAYLWHKEKDTENKLAETKAEGEIKNDEEKVHEADLQSGDAREHYESLRRQYLDEHKDDV